MKVVQELMDINNPYKTPRTHLIELELKKRSIDRRMRYLLKWMDKSYWVDWNSIRAIFFRKKFEKEFKALTTSIFNNLGKPDRVVIAEACSIYRISKNKE